ncbi:hypothetical protein D7B24_002452 [Verticillium nonalfalfae]|uniref:MARVEL domain-containing protein n=1 Tax=Verticillium nonalfalfae TaxID=1051616 RepID=A0A3M9YFU7_9PEZI|nr:uncharacterized protein D7B24_002452 [Verticillium nonalfalfae]RNJ59447.1 hypothetical protein D7B24_002452 [Verticillium nonalfalfae]
MVNVAAFFEPHLKLRLHVAETVLIIIALILTGIYISMISFLTRSEIMIIPFSVKSLIIIGYQLLSQHTTRYRKWESLKANMILNFIEPVFWLVVIILKGMGMSRSCTGGSCGVSVAVMLVALVIFALTILVAGISYLDHKHFKRTGVPRGSPSGFAQEQQHQPSAHNYGYGQGQK